MIVERDGIPVVVAIAPIGDYERLIVPDEMPNELALTVATGRKERLARRRLLELFD